MTTPGRIEAVAKAIYDDDESELSPQRCTGWEAEPEDSKADYRSNARAAIAAVAEQPRGEEERVEWGNEDGIEEPMDYTPIGQRLREAAEQLVSGSAHSILLPATSLETGELGPAGTCLRTGWIRRAQFEKAQADMRALAAALNAEENRRD